MKKANIQVLFAEIGKLCETQQEPSKQAIIEIAKRHYDKPDVAKMEEQYWNRKAERIMTMKKDNEGVRDWLSRGDGLYVHLPTTQNRDSLLRVKKQNRKKYVGIRKVLIKINKQENLIGQITIFENENDEF